ncbi:MAG: TrkH family potassium uptake protein [Puniceicoccaceae bacterium]
MNYRILLRLLAVILLVLAAGLACSFSVSLAFAGTFGPGEGEAVHGLELSAGIALGLALLLLRLGRGGAPRFFQREGLAVVGLGWITASLIGAIPYYSTVDGLSFASAFFESASGFSTTGATTFDDVESLPKALLFWRGFTQWIGGLGVVIFFLAVLSSFRPGAKTLLNREYSGNTKDIPDGRIQTAAARILALYAALSLLCACAYRLCGLGWFEAVCHMFTTVSTGGFSTRNNGFADFGNPSLEWVAVVFMITCGLSFLLLLRLARRGGVRFFARNTEAVGYLSLLAAASLFTWFFLAASGESPAAGGTVRAAVFQVTSILTTTGFATRDYALWAAPAQILLLGLMVVGGCSGSTSGGVKVFRIVVAARAIRNHIERAFRPHVVRSVRVGAHALSQREVHDVTTFLVLGGFLAGISCLALSTLEPTLDPLTAIATVITCFGNVGPGLGAVGPAETFAFFGDPAKILLALLMIAGRLELLAILVVAAPSLWKRYS